MKKILFCVTLFSIAPLLSCARSEVGYWAVGPSAKEQTSISDKQLEAQVKQIADTAKGHVGVAAILLDSSKTAPIVSLNAGDHYPMQSVYKLPISMTVLKQAEEHTSELQ